MRHLFQCSKYLVVILFRLENGIKELSVSLSFTSKLSDQLKKKSQDKENQVEMEKGLVILLLCCAGALVAESVPTVQQERVIELLQQELASAKASQYPVAEKQRVGFPTNPVEQEIRNQQIENAVEQGIRHAKEQRTHFPEEQGIRNQQIEQGMHNQQIEQGIRSQQIEEQQIQNAAEQRVGFPTNPVEQQIETAKEQQSTDNGAVYTRWGRTECPSTATLIYNGRAGGAHYSHAGTAANFICLPNNPEYYSSGKPATYAAYVYGSEYETWGSPLANLANHNVPCAVCYSGRSSMIMVPAKITCPSQWTREYNGYLMAGYYAHASAKNFVCMDKDPESVRGSAASTDGALFYHARLGNCYGLDCSPYNTHKDLACVVCTM